MPKIRMLKDANGCDDGIHAKDYVKGESYDVSDSLANDFVSLEACELVPTVSFQKEKAVEHAPKNKAHHSAPSNKSDLGDK